MGFSRQEYQSGLPFPSPEDLDPEIEPRSSALQADSLPSELWGSFYCTAKWISHTYTYMKWSEVKVAQSCLTLCVWPHGLQHARLLFPWNFPGKNTGVGSRSLLQGIFLIQESNQGLLHCRQNLCWLSYQGSPTSMCIPSLLDFCTIQRTTVL